MTAETYDVPQPITKTIHGPYFFEIFTLANLIAIATWMHVTTHAPWTQMTNGFGSTFGGLLAHALLGIAARLLVCTLRRDARAYLDIIRSPVWLIDTARIVIFTVLVTLTYAWIKLMVPILHPRLFDQQLWNLDRTLFFGYSPNIFFLSLFSAPSVLRVVDFTYAWVFAGSMALGLGFFMSAPGRRLRVAFMDATAAMWIIGAWLYMAVPSLGPAYRFPEVWLPLGALLGHTQMLQAILMRNYLMVMRPNALVNIFFGVAAFPSLHVAWQTLAFVWMRRVWRSGEVIFGIFLLLIFLGSVITGWHYLIDSLAGVALALGCSWISMKAHHIVFRDALVRQ